jgi:hypothetical protein
MTTSLNTSVINKAPYLRTSREFPEEIKDLTQEISKTYIEIAGAVNNRVIGIYPSNRPAITGKVYYLTPGRTNKSLRQVYRFTNVPPAALPNPLSIPHGIKFAYVAQFAIIMGTAFDGTNYYPLPYVDVVAATNQISVMLTPVSIVITVGAGAPVITSGIIILEWLVN